MDSEGLFLKLLDPNIVNTEDDDYTISIHRKNAITNVQVKPNPEVFSPDFSTERKLTVNPLNVK